MKNNIIIFGMNKFSDWQNNTNQNRSYYILQEIIKRDDIDKILFIDYFPVKRLAALKNYTKILKNYTKSNIFKSPFSFCTELKKDKLYNYLTILSVMNWQWLYNDLNKIIKKLNLNNLILWSFYPLNVDYFEYIKNNISVIHLDDDWKRFKDMNRKSSIDYIDVLRKNYNSISNKADYIFNASDELLEIFMGHDNSYWIDDVNKKNLDKYDWPKLVDEMFNIMKL